MKAGRVSINGKTVTEMGSLIDPASDELAIDGKPVTRQAPPKVYWMLHKPDMTLSSTKPEEGKDTIFDLPSLRGLSFQVYTAGRLDYRTEGLLLLSNDGQFIQHLTHPKYGVARHYYALVTNKLSDQQLAMLRKGIQLEDGPVKGVEIQYAHGKKLGAGRGSWYIVTVHEGRNRLVRRLFEHFELKVVRLIRYGIGDLRLPEDLKPGQYKQLSPAQIRDLKKLSSYDTTEGEV